MNVANKVQLEGVLGVDPEIREIAPGRSVARMSLMTSDTYKNADGVVVTDTQWHTLVAWGKTADEVDRLLKKGSHVSVEGRLVHRSYEGKGGVKRYVSEVVVHVFQVLSKNTVEIEDHRTIKEICQEALAVQDASNATAVAGSMHRAMKRMLRMGMGTDTVNQHPVTCLYIDKLCQLAKVQQPDLRNAYINVSRMAETTNQ